MSEETVELVRRTLEAFNRRDIDALLAMIDPDVEFYSRLVELEGGGPFRGHEGVRRWWEALFAISPDFKTQIEDIQASGDMTVVRVRQLGHGAESNAPMDQTQWFVMQWRNGKAISVRVLVSEAEALEAAGMAE